MKMRWVIIGSAVALFLILSYAIAKGIVDKGAKQRCAAIDGEWVCTAPTLWHVTVLACECVEPDGGALIPIGPRR